MPFKSTIIDKNDTPVPGWQDIEKTRQLFNSIKKYKPNSPYLKNTLLEFTETLGLIKEVSGNYLPTTTGILFIGNEKALRELPYSIIKYIRYKSDGSYTPYEYKGDLITIADECFLQLKSEINLKEFRFGLFREFIEDYPEVVIRELLINALAHRDYSRQQIIEIRKYDNYIEFESPGTFPDGINVMNYLRKSNPRNPNIMDIFRETKYAEKAGSGFDKIFTALLSRGKNLPEPIQTDTSIIFRVFSDTYSEKLIEISHLYRELKRKDIDLEKILVLNAIYTGKNATFKDLQNSPFINKSQLKSILDELLELEFIETTGKTSDFRYIIHKSKLANIGEEKQYLQAKKVEKGRQIESILRYLDEFEEIDNKKARDYLNIPESQVSTVSRLFSDMLSKGLIYVDREDKHNQRIYKRKK